MNEEALRRFELRAEIFKALAHPLRICILEKLRDRPWCVCELAAELGIDNSEASRHLSQLRNVGFLAMEKRGNFVEYRLLAPSVLDTAASTERIILACRHEKLGMAAKAWSCGSLGSPQAFSTPSPARGPGRGAGSQWLPMILETP